MTLSTADSTERATQTLVECLRSPACYPEKTQQVTVIETHISWVFLTDRHAYKLKKPIKYDFLDFSTPELRRSFCEAEVQLNRRMAADVYRGVVPVTVSASGRLQIDGAGEAVDWLVRMRRLPASQSLERLILERRLTEKQIETLGLYLAEFYRLIPPLTLPTAIYRDRIEQHVKANWSELLQPLHGLDQVTVRRVHEAQLRVLRLFPEMFDDRVRDGRIVEGHGDLRTDHIYFATAPTVIDCVEFNTELRQLDVLDELCFLAVECAYLNADRVGGLILDRYCQVSGDEPPRLLLPFYLTYRAAVRAKVQALRHQQHEATTARELGDSAANYLALSDRYARELGRPQLIVFRGVSGTGKSTLAGTVAKSLSIQTLRTDQLRAAASGASDARRGFNLGEYAPDRRLAVYDEMFAQAARQLANGLSVILDGTFPTAKLRRRALLLARRYGADPHFFHCHCPDSLAAERVATRCDISESTPDMIPRQRAVEEPDPPGCCSVPLNTRESVPRLQQQIFEELRTAMG